MISPPAQVQTDAGETPAGATIPDPFSCSCFPGPKVPDLKGTVLYRFGTGADRSDRRYESRAGVPSMSR